MPDVNAPSLSPCVPPLPTGPLLRHQRSNLANLPPLLPPSGPPAYSPTAPGGVATSATSLPMHPEPVLMRRANGPGMNAPPPPYAPPPPIPAVPPPAYDLPTAIATVHLCRIDNPFPYPPNAVVYIQCQSLIPPRVMIGHGTRIVHPGIRGWGTEPDDHLRIATRIKESGNGWTAVQFMTIPSSTGVSCNEGDFYVLFNEGAVAKTGWGEDEEDEVEEPRSLFSVASEVVLACFCL